MEVLAAITAPDAVTAILTHLGLPTEPPPVAPARPRPPGGRATTTSTPRADAFAPA